jgi:steroid delta-isomerase-like uncharacterized protein
MTREPLIRRYYTCFNERRFDDAVALFTEDAILEQVPFQRRERGGAAYLVFANSWTRGFPDATIAVDRVRKGPGETYEVELVWTGTHQGDLVIGGCRFKATGVRATLHLREVLEFRDDRIAGACLSFDFQELAQQLSRVDEARLLTHLERLRALETQLRSMRADDAGRQTLLARIGQELDGARSAVRPYFGQ